MGISFSARSAVSTDSVITLRVRRSSPARVHTSPQAPRVMNSWNGREKSVALAVARSTCASPSTSRRTCIPAS